jgi:ABC-2 type transport system permease protein
VRFGSLRAGYVSFVVQLHLSSRVLLSSAVVLTTIPQAVVLGWMVRSSGRPGVTSYVAYGVLMLAAWTTSMLRVGWSLAGEIFSGTFEPALLSRTPIFVVMAAKAFATLVVGLMGGVVAFVVVCLVDGSLPSMERPLLFVIASPVVVASLASVSLLFAPFLVLEAGKAGFMNAFIPAGSVLSGFVYPLSTLPRAMELAGRFLPTPWAAEALIGAAIGSRSASDILGRLAMSLLLVVAWTVITWQLFRVVDRRIRVTAQLRVA